MNLNRFSQRIPLDQPGTQPDAESFGRQYPRALSRPQGRGRDFRQAMTFAPLPAAITRQVPPPDPELPEHKKGKTVIRLQGPLGRLFGFLRGGAPAAKKLRLAETVALGEKRFVAIIHAEGHKYLIGGSSSGVSLLTQLDDSATLAKTLPSLKGAIEAAG